MSERYYEIEQVIKSIENRAYARGLCEGASRLNTLASIVPSSITKSYLIALCRKEAEALTNRADRLEPQ